MRKKCFSSFKNIVYIAIPWHLTTFCKSFFVVPNQKKNQDHLDNSIDRPE